MLFKIGVWATILATCWALNYKTSPVSLSSGGFLSTGYRARSLAAFRPTSQRFVPNKGQILQAAVQTKHQIKYIDVPSTQNDLQPSVVHISSQSLPVLLLFKSSSTQLNVRQMHEAAKGSNQETNSEDEPHRLVHLVNKPVIQEIREVISPLRRIVQEIKPVQEEIQTIVAKNSEQQQPPVQNLLPPAQSSSQAANVRLHELAFNQPRLEPVLAPAQVVQVPAAPVQEVVPAPAPVVEAPAPIQLVETQAPVQVLEQASAPVLQASQPIQVLQLTPVQQQQAVEAAPASAPVQVTPVTLVAVGRTVESAPLQPEPERLSMPETPTLLTLSSVQPPEEEFFSKAKSA